MPKPVGLVQSRTTRILVGDVLDQLRTLPSDSVQCCATSPPYWGLRDYGVPGQLGLEKTPEEYVNRMVTIFRELRRVLRPDGIFWLNIGDSYATRGGSGKQGVNGQWADRRHTQLQLRGPESNGGCKPKDLVGIPWMLAFALRDDGWYLRQDIIWHKPAPMPESVRDRCTKSHEYIFLLTKRGRYYYDAEAVKEASVDRESINGRNPRNGDAFTHSDPDGFARTRVGFAATEVGKTYPTRNLRSVWTMAPLPFKGKHFAVFPPELVERCVLAGTSAVGCCPICRKPWKRTIVRERVSTRPGAETKVVVPKGWQVGPGSHNTISHQTPEGEQVRLAYIVTGNRDPQRHVTVSLTKGWERDCEHLMGRERLVPCTVIDPFAGSGTTVITAELLGRSAVGIDLDPRVHEFMAIRRPEVEKWFTKRNKRKMKEEREKAEERMSCAE